MCVCVNAFRVVAIFSNYVCLYYCVRFCVAHHGNVFGHVLPVFFTTSHKIYNWLLLLFLFLFPCDFAGITMCYYTGNITAHTYLQCQHCVVVFVLCCDFHFRFTPTVVLAIFVVKIKKRTANSNEFGQNNVFLEFIYNIPIYVLMLVILGFLVFVVAIFFLYKTTRVGSNITKIICNFCCFLWLFATYLLL